MSNRKHSKETLEMIHAAWARGDDASTIGASINASRNAVIGIVHRNKMERDPEAKLNRMQISAMRAGETRRAKKNGHVHNIAVGPQKSFTRMAAAFLRSEPYLVLPDDPPLVDNLLKLEDDQCRWPIGDPKDKESFGFCGKRRHSHYFSYCANHVRRSVPQPPPPPGQTAANDSQPRHRIVEAAE